MSTGTEQRNGTAPAVWVILWALPLLVLCLLNAAPARAQVRPAPNPIFGTRLRHIVEMIPGSATDLPPYFAKSQDVYLLVTAGASYTEIQALANPEVPPPAVAQALANPEVPPPAVAQALANPEVPPPAVAQALANPEVPPPAVAQALSSALAGTSLQGQTVEWSAGRYSAAPDQPTLPLHSSAGTASAGGRQGTCRGDLPKTAWALHAKNEG